MPLINSFKSLVSIQNSNLFMSNNIIKKRTIIKDNFPTLQKNTVLVIEQ